MSHVSLEMEMVFFRLHQKVVRFLSTVFGPRLLWMMEQMVLINALISLGVLMYLHSTFVTGDTTTCVIDDLKSQLQESDVLHLYVKGIWSRLEMVDAQGAQAVLQTRETKTHQLGGQLIQAWLVDPIFSFSNERGFLLLNNDLREAHNIKQANVSVHFDCLAYSSQILFILDNFIGYDTVMSNILIHLFQGKGFMYSSHSRELVNLEYSVFEQTDDVFTHAAFKIGVVVTTVFLFFITTTLVHHTLRETQEKMLQFTFDLQNSVNQHISCYPLIINHVVNSVVFVPIMVGMLFFLFEFFNDQLLAFIVLAMVWITELYSVISLRCKISIRVFPRVFFLQFTLFHLYFFAFPSGFTYIALTTTVLFLQHSMILFWNKYEIPALQNGQISSQNMRELNRPHLFPTADMNIYQGSPSSNRRRESTHVD